MNFDVMAGSDMNRSEDTLQTVIWPQIRQWLVGVAYTVSHDSTIETIKKAVAQAAISIRVCEICGQLNANGYCSFFDNSDFQWCSLIDSI
jgi:hypothetical protein